MLILFLIRIEVELGVKLTREVFLDNVLLNLDPGGRLQPALSAAVCGADPGAERGAQVRRGADQEHFDGEQEIRELFLSQRFSARKF